MRTDADRRGLAHAVIKWFRAHARELPWRTRPRDPYASLVSELMLQQTQVERVKPRFAEFMRRFPTVRSLARADEGDVLAAWSGLGYYRRARLLHAAAKRIVAEHAGDVPRDVASLRALPGVGRYTAGAIASMAFQRPEPIVDGNVARVLLRINGIDAATDDRAALEQCWSHAQALVETAHQLDAVAELNEGLMELGATICAPSAPRCQMCPLRDHCAARASGMQEEIPRPRTRATQREVFHSAAVLRDGRGNLLVQRRPDHGLWAGMWQPPTIERDDAPASARALGAMLGVTGLRKREQFTHVTTHRLVRFGVWEAQINGASAALSDHGEWRSLAELEPLALSNPHRRILLSSR